MKMFGQIFLIPTLLFLMITLTLSQNASAQLYKFTFDTSASKLTGPANFTVKGKGNLIGDYNSTTNPNGTRTKPGTSGAFGDKENVAVTMSPVLTASGKVNSSIGGKFSLNFNLTKKQVTLTDFETNFLASGALPLTGTIKPNTSAFRTRNPTFLYPAFSSNMSVGDTPLNSFVVKQPGTAKLGTLTAAGKNTYSFSLNFLADVSVQLTYQGESETFTFSAPFTLSGQVVISGNSVVFSNPRALGGIVMTSNVNTTFPPQPASLPGLTGKPANVVLNLTFNQATLNLGNNMLLKAQGIKSP